MIVNSHSLDVVAAFVVYFHTQSIFSKCCQKCSVFVFSCELTCAGTLSMQRKLVSVRKPFPRSGRSAQPHHPKRASKSGGCQGEGAQGGHIHHSLHSATGDPGISMSIHRDRSQLHPKRLPCTASCGKSPQNPATTHPPDLPINDHPMCVM